VDDHVAALESQMARIRKQTSITVAEDNLGRVTQQLEPDMLQEADNFADPQEMQKPVDYLCDPGASSDCAVLHDINTTAASLSNSEVYKETWLENSSQGDVSLAAGEEQMPGNPVMESFISQSSIEKELITGSTFPESNSPDSVSGENSTNQAMHGTHTLDEIGSDSTELRPEGVFCENDSGPEQVQDASRIELARSSGCPQQQSSLR